MGRPKRTVRDKTVGVRFPEPLLEQIKMASAMMPGYSEADIIRLATEIGLVRLRRINYKLAETIDDAASPAQPREETLRVAETPPNYGGVKK